MRGGLRALPVVAQLFGVPLAARAQPDQITIRVDGLSCPFCAYSLEKKLGAVPGIERLVIDIAEATAILTPTSDSDPKVDFAALRRAVRDAGFTPREVRVRGLGRIIEVATGLQVVGPEGQPLFALEPAAASARPLRAGDRLLRFEGLVVPSEAGEAEGAPLLPRLVLKAASPADGG